MKNIFKFLIVYFTCFHVALMADITNEQMQEKIQIIHFVVNRDLKYGGIHKDDRIDRLKWTSLPFVGFLYDL